MTPDEHYKLLGKLVGNLQSLEFILRGFLHGLSSPRPDGIPYGTDWYSFPVDHEVPLDEFTNYDTLGELIRKFNEEMGRRSAPAIDGKGLVALRDALAHGRVSSNSPVGDMRLLKFSNHRRGDRVVRVVFNEQMTKAWFQDQIARVHRAILAVNKVMPG